MNVFVLPVTPELTPISSKKGENKKSDIKKDDYLEMSPVSEETDSSLTCAQSSTTAHLLHQLTPPASPTQRPISSTSPHHDINEYISVDTNQINATLTPEPKSPGGDYFDMSKSVSGVSSINDPQSNLQSSPDPVSSFLSEVVPSYHEMSSHILPTVQEKLGLDGGYIDMSANDSNNMSPKKGVSPVPTSVPRPDKVPSFLTDDGSMEDFPKRAYSVGSRPTGIRLPSKHRRDLSYIELVQPHGMNDSSTTFAPSNSMNEGNNKSSSAPHLLTDQRIRLSDSDYQLYLNDKNKGSEGSSLHSECVNYFSTTDDLLMEVNFPSNPHSSTIVSEELHRPRTASGGRSDFRPRTTSASAEYRRRTNSFGTKETGAKEAGRKLSVGSNIRHCPHKSSMCESKACTASYRSRTSSMCQDPYRKRTSSFGTSDMRPRSSSSGASNWLRRCFNQRANPGTFGNSNNSNATLGKSNLHHSSENVNETLAINESTLATTADNQEYLCMVPAPALVTLSSPESQSRADKSSDYITMLSSKPSVKETKTCSENSVSAPVKHEYVNVPLPKPNVPAIIETSTSDTNTSYVSGISSQHYVDMDRPSGFKSGESAYVLPSKQCKENSRELSDKLEKVFSPIGNADNGSSTAPTSEKTESEAIIHKMTEGSPSLEKTVAHSLSSEKSNLESSDAVNITATQSFITDSQLHTTTQDNYDSKINLTEAFEATGTKKCSTETTSSVDQHDYVNVDFTGCAKDYKTEQFHDQFKEVKQAQKVRSTSTSCSHFDKTSSVPSPDPISHLDSSPKIITATSNFTRNFSAPADSSDVKRELMFEACVAGRASARGSTRSLESGRSMLASDRLPSAHSNSSSLNVLFTGTSRSLSSVESDNSRSELSPTTTHSSLRPSLRSFTDSLPATSTCPNSELKAGERSSYLFSSEVPSQQSDSSTRPLSTLSAPGECSPCLVQIREPITYENISFNRQASTASSSSPQTANGSIREINYASLDLSSSSANDELNGACNAALSSPAVSSSDPSSPHLQQRKHSGSGLAGVSRSCQADEERAISYAQIDFTKSEGLRKTVSSLRSDCTGDL